jgi:hypothetical protein
MATLKVTVQGVDRQTLVNLVKAERRATEIKSNHVVTASQKRAIEFYEDHLKKVQRKLNPSDSYINKY